MKFWKGEWPPEIGDYVKACDWVAKVEHVTTDLSLGNGYVTADIDGKKAVFYDVAIEPLSEAAQQIVREHYLSDEKPQPTDWLTSQAVNVGDKLIINGEPHVVTHTSSKRSNEPELVIIRGLPGSGKSTLAKSDYPNHLHYEPDHLLCDTRGEYRFDYQIFDDAKRFVMHMADFALSRGEDVVVSDVFLKLDELEPYREIAEAHRASIKVIDCNGNYQNCHKVPLMVLKRMARDFEPFEDVGAPDKFELTEAFDVPAILQRQAD